MPFVQCPVCRQLIYGEHGTQQNCSNCNTGIKIPLGYQAQFIDGQPIRRRCEKENCSLQLCYKGMVKGKA